MEKKLSAVTLPTFCEFVWVARARLRSETRGNNNPGLVDSAGVRVDRPAVEAGLAVFEAGGNFADGVIAFAGRRMGGSIFTGFDRRAIELIAATGAETRLLSAE